MLQGCDACIGRHDQTGNHPDFETESGGEPCAACSAHHTMLDAEVTENTRLRLQNRVLQDELDARDGRPSERLPAVPIGRR